LTARGVPPIGTIHHVVDWFYVVGAVAPTTGESFFFEVPHLNRVNFHVFLDQFVRAFPASLNLLVLDKRGGHTAKQLRIPENVCVVWRPPYSPERNPIERVWRDLKDQLAWQQFADVEAQQEYVADVLCAYDAMTLQALTAYPYFVDAVNALSP
jgi:transposase